MFLDVGVMMTCCLSRPLCNLPILTPLIRVQTLLQSGVQNYLIVGLDKQIRDHLVSKGLNVYYHQVAVCASWRRRHVPQCCLNRQWCVGSHAD